MEKKQFSLLEKLIDFATANWDEYSNQQELLNEMAVNCGLDYYIEQLTGASDYTEYGYYVATMCCPFGILCFKTEIYERDTPEELAQYALDIQEEYEAINNKFLSIN